MKNLKSYLFELSLKYIRYYNKDTNYVRHANAEYKIAWPDMDSDKEDEGMQRYMCNQVNDLLYLLSSQGDSGGSIGYKLNLFTKLARFEIISPLTFKDDEFGNPYDNDELKQNKRDSRVFKRGDKYSFNDAFIKHGKFYIGEDNIVIEREGGNWSGGLFVVPKDGDIYYLNNEWIKDITKWSPSKKFYIDSYELEYPKDWWIGLCKEDDLKEFSEYYDFEKNYEEIEKELSYKDNQYRSVIIEKIELVRNYMYNK